MASAKDLRTHHRLTIESSDRDELSEYFSSRVSRVFVSASAGASNVELAASVVAVGDVVAFKSFIPSGARFRQGEDLNGFFIQLPQQGHVRWRQGSQEVVCSPDVGFLGRMSEGDLIDFSTQWSQFALKVPYEHIARSLSQLLDQPLLAPLEFQSTFEAQSPAAKSLSSLIQVASTPLDDNPFLAPSSLAARRFAECLAIFILENFDHNYSDMLSSSGHSVRPKYVKRAMEFMRVNAERPMTLQDISEAAEISVRALHYGFKQFLGMSPFEYLRKIRLEAAYADLMKAPENLSIAEIAKKWGFPNAGRFAQYCKQSYGHTPSEIRQLKRNT